MAKYKYSADINGNNWEVGYPFCAGCDELIVGGTCGFASNGCKYPFERVKMPVNFTRAFFSLCKLYAPKETVETIAQNLGDCLD